MADQIIVVNFEALEDAADAFTTSAGRIAEIAGSVRANASAIQSAIQSNAAGEYVAKANALASNVDVAQERLNERVQVLRTEAEKARAAESKAQSIAESVTTFKMM